ncbi:MAG TPA: hypothetical protein PLI43_17450 [Albidovulum sp.]|uniref:hypothetical protein n=1 Tax=Albidovulum sp. TaxID=1872424 RepID=UPI002C0DE79F|nr:hypothetical protein [Albidovulum sp.]
MATTILLQASRTAALWCIATQDRAKQTDSYGPAVLIGESWAQDHPTEQPSVRSEPNITNASV